MTQPKKMHSCYTGRKVAKLSLQGGSICMQWTWRAWTEQDPSLWRQPDHKKKTLSKLWMVWLVKSNRAHNWITLRSKSYHTNLFIDLLLHALLRGLQPLLDNKRAAKIAFQLWLKTNDRHQYAHTVINALGHPLRAWSSHYAMDGPEGIWDQPTSSVPSLR